MKKTLIIFGFEVDAEYRVNEEEQEVYVDKISIKEAGNIAALELDMVALAKEQLEGDMFEDELFSPSWDNEEEPF